MVLKKAKSGRFSNMEKLNFAVYSLSTSIQQFPIRQANPDRKSFDPICLVTDENRRPIRQSGSTSYLDDPFKKLQVNLPKKSLSFDRSNHRGVYEIQHIENDIKNNSTENTKTQNIKRNYFSKVKSKVKDLFSVTPNYSNKKINSNITESNIPGKFRYTFSFDTENHQTINPTRLPNKALSTGNLESFEPTDTINYKNSNVKKVKNFKQDSNQVTKPISKQQSSTYPKLRDSFNLDQLVENLKEIERIDDELNGINRPNTSKTITNDSEVLQPIKFQNQEDTQKISYHPEKFGDSLQNQVLYSLDSLHELDSAVRSSKAQNSEPKSTMKQNLYKKRFSRHNFSNKNRLNQFDDKPNEFVTQLNSRSLPNSATNSIRLLQSYPANNQESVAQHPYIEIPSQPSSHNSLLCWILAGTLVSSGVVGITYYFRLRKNKKNNVLQQWSGQLLPNNGTCIYQPVRYNNISQNQVDPSIYPYEQSSYNIQQTFFPNTTPHEFGIVGFVPQI